MTALLLGMMVLAAPPAAPADHAPFDGLLREHIADGRVNYPAIAQDGRLTDYLAQLAAAQPDAEADDAAKLALYLNAYNAFVLQTVVDHWPVATVTRIKGFFDTIRHPLAGREVTLDQLTNELIRPFGDARVHAALSTGAAGGPPLRAEAYVGARLDEQLVAQCRAWLADPDCCRIDRDQSVLWVSMMFRWFADDFERAGGPAGFVKDYIADEADRSWIGEGGYQVRFVEYAWELNGP